MDRHMRRPILIDCLGSRLVGIVHPAEGDTGVVIVTGGVQIRTGSHRGFVDLADRLATAGFTTLRYDRRGVGDSDGIDPGFRDSAPDIGSAVAAFRAAYPQLKRVIGWGLCDGAAALAMFAPEITGLDGLILANPWTIDGDRAPELPPRAAIANRYRDRLRDPRAWVRVVRHGFDVKGVAKGIARLVQPEPVSQVARRMAQGLQRFDGPVLILLAGRDNTAQAFDSLWRSAPFKLPRARKAIETARIGDATHTFADPCHAQAMAERCLDWLSALPRPARASVAS